MSRARSIRSTPNFLGKPFVGIANAYKWDQEFEHDIL